MSVETVLEQLTSLLQSLAVRARRRRLEGFYSNILVATPEIARLHDEDIPCDYIPLSVNNTDNSPSDTYLTKDPNNLYDEAELEIYWGFDNNPVHQIFPTQPWPYLIPVSNCRDIFVRCNVN